MQALTVKDIKKALVQAGFEVYRTRGAEVHLAERPRENLIMDAGVVLTASEAPCVRWTVHAQSSDFPGETEKALFQRARALGAPAVARGYAEQAARVRPVFDPGDATKVLDTWYEVSFEKVTSSLEEALIEARVVMGFEKAVTRSEP